MSSLTNRVTLIGNLGQDPETKTTETGKKITHFTLATKEGYKGADGQRVSETTWHNIVRIVYRTYEDKKGVTKYITEIVLNDLTLLRNGRESGKNVQEKDV